MEIREKAAKIIKESSEGIVGIVTKEGYPHAAARSNLKTEGIEVCYFTSNHSGTMIQSILNNEKTCVCYHTESNNITLLGRSVVVDDKKIKEEMWQDWFINHYKGGVTDPEYVVIKFTTEKASLWIDREVVKLDI